MQSDETLSPKQAERILEVLRDPRTMSCPACGHLSKPMSMRNAILTALALVLAVPLTIVICTPLFGADAMHQNSMFLGIAFIASLSMAGQTLRSGWSKGCTWCHKAKLEPLPDEERARKIADAQRRAGMVVEHPEALEPVPAEAVEAEPVPAKPTAEAVEAEPVPVAEAVEAEPGKTVAAVVVPEPAVVAPMPEPEPEREVAPQATPEVAVAPEARAPQPAAAEPPGTRRPSAGLPRITWVLGGLLAVALVVIAVLAFGGRNAKQEAVQTTAPPATEVPAASSSALKPSASKPDDTVRAMYEALADGDADSARRMWAQGFAIDSATLSTWGQPEFVVTQVAASGVPDEIKVEVHEPGGGFATEYATWTLRKEAGAWLVSGWFTGRLAEDPTRRTANSGSSDPMVVSAVRGAVGEFLNRRITGDIAGMKAMATKSFIQEQPEVFTFKPQEFTGFNVGDVRSEDDQWSVTAQEQWASGGESHEYVVVVQDGVYLVDQER